MHVLLSKVLQLLILILSVLWVQVRMQHDAPFNRATQCFFNLVILQHQSQDIYESNGVIYWRTQQYRTKTALFAAYSRLIHSLSILSEDSLYILRPKTRLNAVRSQATYTNKPPQLLYCSLKHIDFLLNQTLLNGTYYQYLKKHVLTLYIPIIYRNEQMDIQLTLITNLNSHMLAKITLNTLILTPNKDQQISQQRFYYSQSPIFPSLQDSLQLPFKHLSQSSVQSLTVRKRPALFNMQLNNVFLRNIVLCLQLILVLFQYNQNKPQFYLSTIGIVIVLFSFVSVYAIEGLICLVFWCKTGVSLSQSSNALMLIRLIKGVIKIFVAIILNVTIIFLGVLLMSSIFYPKKKFQNSYVAYLTNFFQYGIYENFIALKSQGVIAQSLYFIQLFFLVMVCNNLLQSVLASQVLKQSKLKIVKEKLALIDAPCPKCNWQPKKHEQIMPSSQIQIKKQQLVLRFVKENKFIQDQQIDYIKIQSPKLSPFLPPILKKKAKFQIYQSQINSKQFSDYYKNIKDHLRNISKHIHDCKKITLTNKQLIFYQKNQHQNMLTNKLKKIIQIIDNI